MNTLRSAVTIGLAVSPVAWGQTQSTTKSEPETCIPIVRISQDYVIAKGMPYSATRVSTCERTEADGTVVKGKKIRREWRDAEGRTRRQEIDPLAPQYQHILVTDPVDHVQWSWTVGRGADKTAIMWHYKLPGEYVIYSDTYPTLPDGTKNRSVFGPMLRNEGPGWKIETMTPTYINGVWAEGQRDIHVVRPGEGNNHTDHAQTVVGEAWVAVDLKEVIRDHTNDPSLGRLTDDLVKIDRSDPDPALFRPPADYHILESHPQPAKSAE